MIEQVSAKELTSLKKVPQQIIKEQPQSKLCYARINGISRIE